MTEQWDTKDTRVLIDALLSMRSAAEMKTLLRDLLTEPEIIEFSKRFRAARALSKGIYYDAIVEDTGLSTRTIARIQRWRKKGKGGYGLALSRLSK